MKLLHALLLGLVSIASARAQDTQPAAPQSILTPNPNKRLIDTLSQERVDFMERAIAQAEAEQKPPASQPAETVKPAIPVPPLAPDQPQTFTQDQVREIETTLKKQMMLVGMGSAVVGLLIGMMIGRKTAPRPMGRRY